MARSAESPCFVGRIGASRCASPPPKCVQTPAVRRTFAPPYGPLPWLAGGRGDGWTLRCPPLWIDHLVVFFLPAHQKAVDACSILVDSDDLLACVDRKGVCDDRAGEINGGEVASAQQEAMGVPVGTPARCGIALNFEKKEHQLFGEDGFEKMVDRVASIEKTLGIYDLAQFTPKL